MREVGCELRCECEYFITTLKIAHPNEKWYFRTIFDIKQIIAQNQSQAQTVLVKSKLFTFAFFKFEAHFQSSVYDKSTKNGYHITNAEQNCNRRPSLK